MADGKRQNFAKSGEGKVRRRCGDALCTDCSDTPAATPSSTDHPGSSPSTSRNVAAHRGLKLAVNEKLKRHPPPVKEEGRKIRSWSVPLKHPSAYDRLGQPRKGPDGDVYEVMQDKLPIMLHVNVPARSGRRRKLAARRHDNRRHSKTKGHRSPSSTLSRDRKTEVDPPTSSDSDGDVKDVGCHSDYVTTARERTESGYGAGRKKLYRPSLFAKREVISSIFADSKKPENESTHAKKEHHGAGLGSDVQPSDVADDTDIPETKSPDVADDTDIPGTKSPDLTDIPEHSEPTSPTIQPGTSSPKVYWHKDYVARTDPVGVVVESHLHRIPNQSEPTSPTIQLGTTPTGKVDFPVTDSVAGSCPVAGEKNHWDCECDGPNPSEEHHYPVLYRKVAEAAPLITWKKKRYEHYGTLLVQRGKSHMVVKIPIHDEQHPTEAMKGTAFYNFCLVILLLLSGLFVYLY